MTTPLNTQEETLLQYWLADGAPGYATGRKITQSDFASIKQLDNGVLRQYLSTYLPDKIRRATHVANREQILTNKAQTKLTAAQKDLTTVSALSVQTS